MIRLSGARRFVLLIAASLVAAGCGGPAAPPSIAVGAAADPESQLVAHLYAAALRFYGNPAHVHATDDPLGELDSGDIRVAPGFSGRLLEAVRAGLGGPLRCAGLPHLAVGVA